MNVWLENHKTVVALAHAPVRCVECGHEYELPPIGQEFGCAACGCSSWVVLPARLAERPAA